MKMRYARFLYRFFSKSLEIIENKQKKWEQAAASSHFFKCFINRLGSLIPPLRFWPGCAADPRYTCGKRQSGKTESAMERP